MKKYIIIITVLLSIMLNYESGICGSWDDLDEGEHDIYGSEREEKFPVKAFFLEKEVWENHYSFMLFWLYKHTDYPRYKSTRVLPFYYGLDSKIDNRSMTVIPPLLSYFETDGTLQTSFIFTPLYFSSLDTDTSDRSLLFLLWWGNHQNKWSKGAYQTLFPVSYHSSNVNPETGRGEYLWVNPLFVSYSENYAAEDLQHLWWFPIIPVFSFNSVDQYSGHRNILMLMDYSWSITNGEDRMDRFWLLPLFLWERGNDGYTAVNPLYINNRHSNGDTYTHFLPLFASWTETGFKNAGMDRLKIEETITLLSLRRKVTDEKSGEITYSNFGFPLLPFIFFRSRDASEGTHTKLLSVIDWESDREGTLKSLSLFPFVFNQTGESGYKYYPPFYCKPSGATEEDGYSFGLFHYYEWRKSGSTVWSWPYYSNEQFFDIPAAKGSNLPAERVEYYYTHFLPVYFSWNTPESTGQIIFPLVLNYKDRQTDLHVNLTGFAKKTYMGPFNPDISVGLAKKDDTWYFDSDYSWFYDVISVSSRFPIVNPFKSKDSDAAEKVIPENDSSVSAKKTPGMTEKINDGKSTLTADEFIASEQLPRTVGITGKKGVNREDSEFFFGWKLLFGWMAYERADTGRHFRLIPLTWFTWDEKANDKLYVFLPFFLSYASEETKEEYFVVAPLYASQKQDKSYAKAYLIDLYWDEYTADSNLYEKTILWPFINWYTSPDKSGFRFFPVVWHKEWKEGGEESSRTIVAPVYYSKDVKNTASGEYISRDRVNLLYCLDEEKQGSSSTYSIFAPIIPLFYHSSDTSGAVTSNETITPFFSYSSEKTQNSADSSYTVLAPIIPLFYRNSEVKGSTALSRTITPLYYYSNVEIKQASSILTGSTLWFPILPAFYYNSEGAYSHWNLLGFLDGCSDNNYSRFFLFPLYYSTVENEDRHKNILGIIDWQSGAGDNSSLVLFPLYYGTSENGEKHKNILGIIDWWSNENVVNTSMVFPFYWWSGDHDSSTLVLFPLLSYFNSEPGEKTRFVAGAYWHESPSYEQQNFLYLFDHEKFISGPASSDKYSLLLTTMEYEISRDISEMRLLWGTLYSYRNFRGTSDYDIDALMWLAGIERSEGYFHNRIMPLYWYTSERDQKYLLIPPLLSYFSKDSNGDFDLAALGLVYYRNEDISAGEDRRMWLLGSLYNEVKVPERKYHARGSLWGILWDYETEGETDFTKFTILKGLYKYIDRKGESEHTILWVF